MELFSLSTSRIVGSGIQVVHQGCGNLSLMARAKLARPEPHVSAIEGTRRLGMRAKTLCALSRKWRAREAAPESEVMGEGSSSGNQAPGRKAFGTVLGRRRQTRGVRCGCPWHGNGNLSSQADSSFVFMRLLAGRPWATRRARSLSRSCLKTNDKQ